MAQDDLIGYHLLHAINAFGHMMLEPFFLLNPGPEDPKQVMVLYPDDRQPANSAVLKIIQRYFTVFPMAAEKFWLLMQGKLTMKDIDGRPCVPLRSVDFALDRWAEKLLRGDFASPRFMALSDEEIEEGKRIQENIGIGTDEPFICIHNRDAGYHPHITNQKYRDSQVSSFIPAIQFLLQKKFRVVRIGDESMTPLPAMPGLFDLTQMKNKHPLTDIWIGSRCLFMLCHPSGPLNIPIAFNGPPVLIVNLVDHPTYPMNALDRYILKPIRIKHQGGRLLNFNERMLVMRHHPRDNDFDRFGLDIIPNSADEILDAVEEMVLDIEKGTGVDTTTRLQQAFKEQAKQWHELYSVCRSYEPYHLFNMPLSNRYLERYSQLLFKESLLRGEELFQAGNLKEAQTFFAEIVQANPEHYEAMNNLATILYTQGDISSAENLYLEALSLKNDDDDILLNIADLYFNLRRWKDAVPFLERYLNPPCRDHVRMNQLALAYMELGSPQQAIQILIKSLEIRPDQTSIRNALETLQPTVIHSSPDVRPFPLGPAILPDDKQ
ncbi:MAG: TIGR04372 family glycosyltransferase [Syntrophales bacterium]|jgi:putative glycosyltransferase (TIGR04372 family)